MKHRNARGLTALALASALLLSACSSDDSSDGASASTSPPSGPVALAACKSTPTAPTPTPTPTEPAPTPTTSEADAAVLDSITVNGDPGAAAALTMTAPLTVSAEAIKVLNEGTGGPLVEDDMLSFQLVSYLGSTGAQQDSTWTTTPASARLNATSFPPMLLDAIVGKPAGTRVLYAQPTTNQDGTTDTTIYVIDLLSTSVPVTRAEGEPVTPEAGLPLVTLDEDGKPAVEITEGTMSPATLVAQTLIKGAGPVVAAGESVTFNYTGWTTDCAQFDSSWDSGTPFTTAIGTGAVIEGWDQGLVGQTVGSQVLLFIPRDLAYGKSEGSELKDDDLIFVVDILSATPAS